MTIDFGVIGYGNIGRTHVDTLLSDAVPGARVCAVASRAPVDLPPGIERFASVEALLAEASLDAVVVATPTHYHLEAASQVLAAGKHLVVEKPIAMSAASARGLASTVPDHLVAAAMLNQRYHPIYARIKSLLDSGALGKIVRFGWIMTAWYRPDVYYLVSSWRGTWPGEGGGLLLNQCIHNLDILYWLFGMPTSLIADAHFGKFHEIDVEDEASVLLRYADGGSGMLVASTGEAPGRNLLEIVGDRGTLTFDGERIVVARAEPAVSDFTRDTRDMFGMPEFTEAVVSVDDTTTNQHAAVFNDVIGAIDEGRPSKTPLGEGLGSLTLANAILLSAWEDRRVPLPLDERAYEAELTKRMADSELREPLDLEVNIDMSQSYR